MRKIKAKGTRNPKTAGNRPKRFPQDFTFETVHLTEGYTAQEYLEPILKNKMVREVTLETELPKQAPTLTRVTYLVPEDLSRCFQIDIQLNRRIELFAYNPESKKLMRLLMPYVKGDEAWLAEYWYGLLRDLRNDVVMRKLQELKEESPAVDSE